MQVRSAELGRRIGVCDVVWTGGAAGRVGGRAAVGLGEPDGHRGHHLALDGDGPALLACGEVVPASRSVVHGGDVCDPDPPAHHCRDLLRGARVPQGRALRRHGERASPQLHSVLLEAGHGNPSLRLGHRPVGRQQGGHRYVFQSSPIVVGVLDPDAQIRSLAVMPLIHAKNFLNSSISCAFLGSVHTLWDRCH